MKRGTMTIKLNYFIFPTLVFLVLLTGYLVTQTGMVWYDANLVLPSIMPPKWTFSLIWNILGVLTSVALVIFWNQCPRDKFFWVTVALFALNGFLTIGWTVAFFVWHALGTAWWIAGALEGTLILIIVLLWNRSRLAAVCMVPYALWVLFALYLNSLIVLIN